jgi:hypothetical protein
MDTTPNVTAQLMIRKLIILRQTLNSMCFLDVYPAMRFEVDDMLAMLSHHLRHSSVTPNVCDAATKLYRSVYDFCMAETAYAQYTITPAEITKLELQKMVLKSQMASAFESEHIAFLAGLVWEYTGIATCRQFVLPFEIAILEYSFVSAKLPTHVAISIASLERSGVNIIRVA